MTTHPLPPSEQARLYLAPLLDPVRRSDLGQYMTSAGVARFMASWFPPLPGARVRLLDAGAGLGALSCAFLDRFAAGELGAASVHVSAYELDEALRGPLADHLGAYAGVQADVIGGDFIALAVQDELWGAEGFTHAILNPPYRKMGSQSAHRHLLRRVGVETVNLYSAFVALALLRLVAGGQLVAIIPRSFCNGPYYRPFRELLLSKAAIRRIHLFESRSQAFKDDDVLQENVILHLERGGAAGDVVVSTSTDDSFTDLVMHTHPFEQIVFPDDPEMFIHIPTMPERGAMDEAAGLQFTLTDLGLKVSTGPVVDFRLRDHLSYTPEVGNVPLIYPAHFNGYGVRWPREDITKDNAIARNAETEKWLYPNGFYCVVKRFSSKEERRRISAAVIDPARFDGAETLGFENHLNVLHEHKRGLPAELAYGLMVYLNSTLVDEYFRRFSGHTQVNATDLKLMKYPSRAVLYTLGMWAMQTELNQENIDAQVKALTT